MGEDRAMESGTGVRPKDLITVVILTRNRWPLLEQPLPARFVKRASISR